MDCLYLLSVLNTGFLVIFAGTIFAARIALESLDFARIFNCTNP